MSETELNALERDVERARAKFADDLARLVSPATFESFKDELWREALQTKDQLVEKTASAAKETAQRIFDDLKDKASANPVAALAIGAGLAWRVATHPPIATVLTGLGLWSLLRTPSHDGQRYPGRYDEDAEADIYRIPAGETGIVPNVQELADSTRQKVQDWGGDAVDAVRQSVSRLAQRAASATERAGSVIEETGTAAQEMTGQVVDKAVATVKRAAATAGEMVPGEETRNNLLLGAAALAISAAIGIAYQQRVQDKE
jgi:hypothetical protein